MLTAGRARSPTTTKEDTVMLSRELALDEARKQKEALAKIGGWRRTLFLITTSLAALAGFGF